MPGGGRDRGGLFALPADVTDRHSPAAGGLVDVVEVAAHLQALGGRYVGRRDVHAGHRRQLAREQAGLERVGDLGPPPEHPVHPDGQGQLLPQFLHQAQVGDLERALAGPPGQGQHSVATLTVVQRHREHRGGPEQHQQRRAARAGAEDVDILGMREQQRAARLMHLARHRAALRLGAAQGAREFRRLVIVRPDHHLPPQPLPPLDVDDDPGRQLAGEQPGALPQGHRLAERRVLQQQPGGGRDQVEPLGYRLDGPEGQRAARRDRRIGPPRLARTRGARICVASRASHTSRQPYQQRQRQSHQQRQPAGASRPTAAATPAAARPAPGLPCWPRR